MARNYFKTTFRFIQKNKLITAINVLSLTIGICATLIIFLMMQFDYSFDKHLPPGVVLTSVRYQTASVRYRTLLSIKTFFTN